MGMGIASGYGAGGAAAGLETVLARRLAEQKFAEEQARAQADLGLRTQGLQLQDQQRRDALAEQTRMHQESEADRADARRLQRINLALMRPIGSYLTEEEVGQEKEMGMPAGFYDRQEGGVTEETTPTGINTKVTAPGYRFRGKEADILKGEDQAKRDQDRDLDRMTRLTLGQLAASTRNQYGPPLVQVQDPDTGQTYYMPRTEAGGQMGPRPAAIRERVDAYRNTLDLVNDIESLGDKIGWAGLGGFGLGGAKRALKRGVGVGSDDAETLRNMLDQLTARASFQEGGKQFTGTEKALLDNFLANVNSNPATAKLRLQTFKESAARSLQSLGANPTPTQTEGAATRRPAPPAGGRSGGPGPAPVRVLKVEPPGTF